jgi:hypothetical protein
MNLGASNLVEPPYTFREAGGVMGCKLCGSRNQLEFSAEMNIHLPGIENLDNPGVLLFPEIVVCLDCGDCRFSLAESELATLARGTRELEHDGVEFFKESHD